ncbi:MAG TPA: adenylate/guanylate cyclase domain-containing protein [Acidimicrobiia bacterium]|nr:adenylate/guanylate cyclase domain-containing protein [Acidimicrobiia bacterium]
MQAFLFTDIESSTRLWEEHPEQMPAALARHDSILRDAVEQSGGRVLKTTGDGMIAVFGSLVDGLGAATQAQKSLGSEGWEATGPLRVRMGVHTGDTDDRDGDHFGPVMNRTARIMAAGHGGQVLLSAIAARLAEDRLPPGTRLRDLGAHRLKDLTLPEHLYQLVQDGLESEFPPLLTLEARPHNFPQQTTEFLGRANELAAIKVMLESRSTRLLTIAGPGGAGKTRLGLQVAAEQMDHFRDGVFFVDLSAERDPDAAFEAVVRTLNLPLAGGGDPLHILKSRLRDRQMLLVLDNFEQVTAAAVGVSELLQAAPDLKIIVTSRETLRVRAEHVFPVPALGLPHPKDATTAIAEAEAVQLFSERARAVHPAFAVTDENAIDVAEICLRLDGLPLAIELAAARLNVFTPSDLLDRLRERLDVLGSGGRDLPDRQRTLWAAIGWSYELLDDRESSIFEMMSVFSTADFPTMEAVSAAALGAGPVVDSISSLVDKSLIRAEEREGSQRFSMLLTIKEYAEARLADSPERNEAVRRAHARHFSEFGRRLHERLRSAGRKDALADLELDIGNVRTAWRYWVDRADLEQVFDLVDGLWALHEAKGWYHAAMELATDALDVLDVAGHPHEFAAQELALRTSLARASMAVHGYGVEVEEAFKAALAMSQTAGTAAQQYPVLRALATYYMGVANFEQGAVYGQRLLEMGEREGDDSIRIEGHYVYGGATSFSGDLETGLPHLERAIELHDPRAHGSARFRLGPNTGVTARVASGLILWQSGALGRSVARLTEALEIARDLDHPYSVAFALYHNGLLALFRSLFDECGRMAHELAAVAEDNDYVVWKTLATVLEGVSLTALGRTEQGLAMTETAIDLYQGLTTPPVFWPQLLSVRSLTHALAGRPEQALVLINDALELGQPYSTAPPDFLVLKGDFLRMLSPPDLVGAEAAYEAGTQDARTAGLHLIELQGLTRLVGLRRELGRLPDGGAELAELYASFTEGHDEHDLVLARDVLKLEDPNQRDSQARSFPE